jgi:hypothetical protein
LLEIGCEFGQGKYLQKAKKIEFIKKK